MCPPARKKTHFIVVREWQASLRKASIISGTIDIAKENLKKYSKAN